MKRKIIVFCLITVLMLTALVPGTALASNRTLTPELQIYAHNLSFNDTIYIKYAVSYSNIEESEISLLIWTEPQTEYTFETRSAVLESVGYQIIDGTRCRIFNYTDLAAKQMTDNIYARAYAKIGSNEYYSDVTKYSILQYAYNMTGKTGTASTDAALLDLLNEMLVFGAKAQAYFNYKTDRLATQDFYQVKVENGLINDLCDNGLYLENDVVRISAPQVNGENAPFSCWKNNAGVTVSQTASFDYTVGTSNVVLTAVYGEAAQTSKGLEIESNGDGTACVLSIGTCTDKDIIIPEITDDGDVVTEIDNAAFAGEDITSIKLPNTITSIGRNAFKDCASLTDVYFDGTEDEWNDISIGSNNQPLTNANIHFAAAATFTVTFKDWDGTVLKTETVNKGGSATPPANPARNGYTFSGWSGTYTNVQSDATVTATYTQISSNSYTVTFYDYDGTSVLKTQSVNSGGSATPPSDPTKAGAQFLGWSGSYANVSENTSVRAVFSDESNVFVMSGAEGNVGDTVTVTLSLKGKVSLCRYSMVLNYDDSVLQLVTYDAELSIYLPTVNPEKDEYGAIINSGLSNGTINLEWAQSSNKTKVADIIELEFKIIGKTSPTTAIEVKSNGCTMISGTNQVNADYSCVNGYVTVH